MTLRGQQAKDLRVEVDHLVPFSHGGQGGKNLRLACGWCNRYKSDNLSLYDQAFAPRRVRDAKGRVQTIPRPFWVVRLLSVRGRCEWPKGCGRTTASAELFVAPKLPGGAMNPPNLMLVCEEHDTLKNERLVSPRLIEVLD
jgi:hypothetical protein